MKAKVKTVENALRKLISTGFFPIIISSVLAKACALLGSIILVRILTKNEYGNYTRVINDYNILFILYDFGCGVAMMQYRGEHFNDKKLRDAYFVEPFKMAMGFCVVSSLIIFLSPVFFPYGSKNEASLTRMLFLTPFLVNIYSFLSLNLRTLTENNKYAILNIAQVVFNYAFLIILSYKFGATGAVLSIYLVYIATIILGIAVSGRNLRFDWKSDILSKSQKISFIKFAFGAQINNSIGMLLSLFDIFIIGLIVSNESVLASYKVAATIPQALSFIPSSIIIYIAPYFARNINDIGWIKRNTKKLILGCTFVNGIITLVFLLSAKWIIPLIYGRLYEDAVPYFLVLMISFFFNGSFQITAANVIFTQHKVRINIIITIISNLFNCALDYLLISSYGAFGAAMATCAVSIITGLISLIFLYKVLNERGINI